MFKIIISLFLTGLLFGSGPCLASCGPFLVAYSAGTARNVAKGIIVYIFFSLARILMYVILSLAIFILGSLVVGGFLGGAYRYILIAGGVFIMIIGLLICLGKRPKFNLGRFMYNNLLEHDKKSIFTVGLITGLLPCAPLLTVLSYIGLISRTWQTSLSYSLAFGIGTFVSPLALLAVLAGVIPRLLFFKKVFYHKIFDNKDQMHHARNVLRLKVNEEVMLFDDSAVEYLCSVEKILAGSIVFRVKEKKTPVNNPAKVKVTIACAMPKASGMDEIIDKLTQLGADMIIPMETERVIVKLDKRKKVLRQERWKKIVLNASQQSQRNTLAVLGPIKDIEEVLSESGDFDLKLIPALIGDRKQIRKVLEAHKPNNILVLIGPEGDFTEREVELAVKAGFIPVSLGNSVLRVETAAVSIAAFIRLHYENS